MILNAYSPRFQFSGFRSLATQIPALTEGPQRILSVGKTPSCIRRITTATCPQLEKMRTGRQRKGQKQCAERRQLAISPGSVERPPRLKLREGGAVQLHYNDIQSQFIQALSNGLWIANPPHRGVAALSLRPQSHHTLTTIDPTKSEGSGPQRCAARALNSGLQ